MDAGRVVVWDLLFNKDNTLCLNMLAGTIEL